MLGLYIHIPFCKARCGYCDFVTYTGKEKLMGPYVKALIKEIEESTRGKKIDTIFIGGGTPTALDDDSFRELLEALNPFAEMAQEFTMEANPESMSPEKAEIMMANGVNRISMGLQSTDNILLKNIGRIHNYETFLERYAMLRKLGFTNLSFDLITALPGQKLADVERTMDESLALEPEHLSVYSLILEEGTPFYSLAEKGKLSLPTEEEDRQFINLVREKAQAKGFQAYEFSNYAKKGYECRHNLNYWDMGDYIGCGVAAAGFLEGERTLNTSNLEEYIQKIESGQSPRCEVHQNSLKETMEEYVFMGLRKTKGIDLEAFNNRFGYDFIDLYGNTLQPYLDSGHLTLENNMLALTTFGVNISNFILSDFLLDEEDLLRGTN